MQNIYFVVLRLIVHLLLIVNWNTIRIVRMFKNVKVIL